MSSGLRQTDARLKRKIFEEGYLFDFFQLVHLLEKWKAGDAPVGQNGPYRSEKIRFRPDLSLVFSPADVRSVESLNAEDGIDRVTVNFMGLYGISAPTPVYLTELLGFTDVDAEPMIDFLDLFNHRIISLFFRAWVKYRFPYRYEPGAQDDVSRCVLSFIGLGDPKISGLTNLPVWRMMKYVGIMALQTRPPECLRLLISDFFGDVQVVIQEFIPRWVRIPDEQKSRIGQANSRIGLDLVIGEKVLDLSGKYRISIGPLTYAGYCAFLPETDHFEDLQEIVRLWNFDQKEFDVELKILREEVPPMQLSGDCPPRLGWTSWVKSPENDLKEDPKIVFCPRVGPVEEHSTA